MLLSVLVPTLSRRTAYLHSLLSVLAPQVTPEVEILIELDSGSQSVGAKRNSLLRRAKGAYVAHVDDDDMVMPDYVSELLAGIAKGVDCVCIKGEFYINSEFKGTFEDRPCREWGNFDNGDGTQRMVRGVQHLDAIKREIAQSVEFPEQQHIRFGEDAVYDKRLEATGLIQNWHAVSKPIYRYLFRSPKVD